MRIPQIATCIKVNGVEGCCAIRVASLLNSELLRDSHYGAADQRSTGCFSKLNQRHLQAAREMLLSAIAPMQDATLEIRILVAPDLVHKAQGEIGMFLLFRCSADNDADAREKTAATFLSLFPILVTYLPEADLKLVRSDEELSEILAPAQLNHAAAVTRRTERPTLASVMPPNTLGFLTAAPDSGSHDDVTVEHLAPWLPSHDDWGRLLEILAGQFEQTMLIIRLRPHTDKTEEEQRLLQTVARCEKALAGMQHTEFPLCKTVSMVEEQCIARLENLKHPCFDVAAIIASRREVSPALASSFGSAISARNIGGEHPAWLQGGFETQALSGRLFLEADFFPEKTPFTIEEAGCAFRLPSPPHREVPGLPVQRFRTNLAKLPPELDESPASIRLFVNEFQGMSQPVHIDPDDRLRHTYIMGQTGTGKSALMESMIVQDILAGRGLAVIDPHGDMIDNVLKKIPKERAEDIILFDLLDRERPLGFNILQWSDIPERDLIIDELYRTLDHIYDMKTTGGPIFEQHFRNMMKLLMGDTKRDAFTPTLLEFIRCYTDRTFRQWLMKSINDQQVTDFITEAEGTAGEAKLANISPYVTSKFSRFVNDTTLRNIVGQEKSSFDTDEIMRKGKIFLIKLGKGRFGSQVSALLANMLVARFKFSAMKRGSLPMEERRDFFLYVDEAHNLPQENFSELLSEARKYRLGLVLATQYCSQLGKVSGSGDDLLAAIFGNVGSLITFRTGTQDAELLAKGFAPFFSALDIMSLPNFHGYARMNLGNQAMIPFSFRTELEDTQEDPVLGRRIRVLSSLKYGTPDKIVEASTYRRSHSWKENEAERAPETEVEAPVTFVNLILLEMGYLELDAPQHIYEKLNEAGLLNIGSILACSRNDLVKRGFTSSQLRSLETCLDKIGCCLNWREHPLAFLGVSNGI